jgi:hypothetical protein
MTATPYLLQLPDPDTSPAPSDGPDTFVVVAESSADAKAFVQNFASRKVWANVTPATLAEAADMSGWSLRVAVFNPSDDSSYLDITVTNANQIERVVLASGVLTSSSNYGTSDTVTIGTRVYSFVASPAVDGDVKIGGTEAASILNLVHAINGSGGTPGTDYVVTAPDPNVTAVAASHTATVTARSTLNAATANAVATTASMTTGNGAWGSATLTGGVDSENKVSSLAELMVAALLPALHASFDNSTHTLTISTIADNIGDHKVHVEVVPPQLNPVSPTGVATKAGQSVPGFVSTITDGGIAGAALTVILAADTYGVPKLVVQARVLQ